MKNYSILSAKNVLVSIADRLPNNLVIDTQSNQGQLAINLIMQLNEKQLSELYESVTAVKDTCFLEIFSVSEKKLGKECPTELRKEISLSNVVKVLFNNNTCPMVQKYTAPSRYVSVTLVTR